MRQPLVFRSPGLHFVDVSLSGPNGVAQHRRFYTHVTQRPKIRAVGGDTRWIAALPADVFDVTQVGPAELAAPDRLQDVDAVVISGVGADRFPPGVLDRLAEDSIFVAETVSHGRKLHGGQGVEEASGQPAQPAIAQAGVGFLFQKIQPVEMSLLDGLLDRGFE